MAKRFDAWFRQLVNEAFWDANFDGVEQAIWSLAVDMGFLGIVNGVEVTQHSPTPDLTVDVSAGVSYDQAGKRCEIKSSVSGLNCAVDENGASTAVTTPGNERWLSVQLRFDRNPTNPKTDGNGDTVYEDQEESYELAVVMAGEYSLGTDTKPALPADGRLAIDIKLIYNQTQIQSGDLDASRRQDFSIFSAAQIPVSFTGWSFLNGAASADVQAVLAFIDARMLTTDSSKELTENIVPSTSGRDLGASGKEWDVFFKSLTPASGAEVAGNLIPNASGNDLGSASKRWSVYSDLLDLNDGQLVMGGTSTVNGDLIPTAAGSDLGNVENYWDAFIRNININSAGKVTGNIIPTATGQTLGDGTTKWDVNSQVNTSYNSTLTGAYVMSGARAHIKQMPLRPLDQPTWGSTTWQWLQAGTWASRTITGWTYSSSSATSGDIELDFKDGITVEDLSLTWHQASGTATLRAEVFQVDYKGTETSKGSADISASGAWKEKEAMGLSDFVVDRTQYTYLLRITGVANEDCALTGIGLSDKVTDVGKAAV